MHLELLRWIFNLISLRSTREINEYLGVSDIYFQKKKLTMKEKLAVNVGDTIPQGWIK